MNYFRALDQQRDSILNNLGIDTRRASPTGHLVFSTLHTNAAPSAFTRLIDMGIEPFLVASSVEAVQAQRLIRTICSHCKTEQVVDRSYLRKIGFPEADSE